MSEPVFDRSALARSASGDETLASELIRLFLTEAEELATRLAAAREAVDRGEMRAVAHRLRGSAGVVGAKRLRAACAGLEQGVDAGPDEIGRLVGRLLEAAEEVRGALQEQVRRGDL